MAELRDGWWRFFAFHIDCFCVNNTTVVILVRCGDSNSAVNFAKIIVLQQEPPAYIQ